MIHDQQIILIDFGFTDKFIDSEGNHISEDAENKAFRGNMVFGTQRQLEFKKTTRKDDLISLAQLMIYMLENQKL